MAEIGFRTIDGLFWRIEKLPDGTMRLHSSRDPGMERDEMMFPGELLGSGLLEPVRPDGNSWECVRVDNPEIILLYPDLVVTDACVFFRQASLRPDRAGLVCIHSVMDVVYRQAPDLPWTLRGAYSFASGT